MAPSRALIVAAGKKDLLLILRSPQKAPQVIRVHKQHFCAVTRLLEKYEGMTAFEAGYIKGLTFPMRREIRPVTLKTKMVGRAFTVDEKAVVLDIYDHLREGDVLIYASHDTEHGVWGPLLSREAMKKDVRGVVVDGCVLRIKTLSQIPLPVFARGPSPVHAPITMNSRKNIPVVCGGVRVLPGDIIVADDDGVVVVPQKNAKKVLEAVDTVRKADVYLERKVAEGYRIDQVPYIREVWEEKIRLRGQEWRCYGPWLKKHGL